jgi:UDP-N-acetylmuramyl pentapeptide phosphotransferase/UDP-N-acetylglucosamine-1-phosphate transferase
MLGLGHVLTLAGVSFVASALVGLVLIRTASWHLPWTGDAVTGDRRKIHARPVPRVGGLGIVLGVLLGGAMLAAGGERMLILLVLCGLPAFLAGFGEDLFHGVSARIRLVATFLAAALAYALLDARVTSLALPASEQILSHPLASLLFTIIVVGGFAHSMNIIDGLHGLAGSVACLIVFAIGAVAWTVGDATVSAAAVVIGGAMVGFLIWNYPLAYIFLGDGGAYLSGFLLGELTVLLVQRNPEVSPWVGGTVLLYPVWETLVSIARRRAVQGRSALAADQLHLHLLVYKRLCRRHGVNRRRYHAVATLCMLAFAALTIIPAAVWYRHTEILQVVAAVFVSAYLLLYRAIVTWRGKRLVPTKALVQHVERMCVGTRWPVSPVGAPLDRPHGWSARELVLSPRSSDPDGGAAVNPCQGPWSQTAERDGQARVSDPASAAGQGCHGLPDGRPCAGGDAGGQIRGRPYRAGRDSSAPELPAEEVRCAPPTPHDAPEEQTGSQLLNET